MLATEEVTEAMAVEAFKRTSFVTHSDAMGTSAPLGRSNSKTVYGFVP
jgi:hypothetical protein